MYNKRANGPNQGLQLFARSYCEKHAALHLHLHAQKCKPKQLWLNFILVPRRLKSMTKVLVFVYLEFLRSSGAQVEKSWKFYGVGESTTSPILGGSGGSNWKNPQCGVWIFSGTTHWTFQKYPYPNTDNRNIGCFLFGNPIKFLCAFLNMYLCCNIVACIACINGDGVFTPVPKYLFPLIIKHGVWEREHMFEEMQMKL